MTEIQLIGDERVLWHGSPRGFRSFVRGPDLMLLFMAVFAGMFFVTASVASVRTPRTDGAPIVVFLFPFVVFGLLFFLPRAVSILRDLSGTRYVVTSRRIVIRGRGREVEFDLANLPHLELERSWVSGPVIYFAQRQMYDGWNGIYGGSTAPSFRGIAGAEDVFRLISQARSEARTR